MGADLHIKRIRNSGKVPIWTVSKEAVRSGYFRDNYNSAGLFAILNTNTSQDFSWWEMSRKTLWFNAKGDLNLKGQEALLKMVKKAKHELEKLDKVYCRPVLGQVPEEVDKREYLEWCDMLIEFLEISIDQKSAIDWSV